MPDPVGNNPEPTAPITVSATRGAQVSPLVIRANWGGQNQTAEGFSSNQYWQGKRYFELGLNSYSIEGGDPHGTSIKIRNNSTTPPTMYEYFNTGRFRVTGQADRTIGSTSSANVFNLCADFDQDRLWVGTNGMWVNGSPSTGAGGEPLLPGAYSAGGFVGHWEQVEITFRLNRDSFLYPVPTGARPWDSFGEPDDPGEPPIYVGDSLLRALYLGTTRLWP